MDNVILNAGSGGATVAADELITLNGSATGGGIMAQRVKPVFGADGTGTDVSPANPMPVVVYGELLEAISALRMQIQSLTRTIGMSMPDTSGRTRVIADLNAAQTLATVTTVSTVSAITNVSAVTNLSQAGTIYINDQMPTFMHLGADSLRRNITVT